jgi:hypothetical protein
MKWAALLVGLAAACQPSGDDLVVPDYTPRVQFDSAYTSNTIAPHFSVQPFPPPRLAAAIAGLVDVATWPELEPAATEAPTFEQVGTNNAVVVVFPLVDKTTDRWYVMRVGTLPEGSKLGERQHIVTLPDGRVGALFRSGSWPAPLQISACGEHDLEVYVSELIVAKVTDLGSLLTVQNDDGPPLACSVFVSDLGIRASCPQLDLHGMTRITIHDGIAGATGVPLKASPFAEGALSWSFRFADVPLGLSQCHVAWLVEP